MYFEVLFKRTQMIAVWENLSFGNPIFVVLLYDIVFMYYKN